MKGVYVKRNPVIKLDLTADDWQLYDDDGGEYARRELVADGLCKGIEDILNCPLDAPAIRLNRPTGEASSVILAINPYTREPVLTFQDGFSHVNYFVDARLLRTLLFSVGSFRWGFLSSCFLSWSLFCNSFLSWSFLS